MNNSDICVLVSYNKNYQELANISISKSISEYCKIHGYHLWIDEQDSITNDRSPAWQKIFKSIEILKTTYFKWLFFLDIDCLIMNPTIKLESLIDDNYSFIVPTHGVPSVDTPILNSLGDDCVITSQYLVKNDEMGLRILEDIWEAKEWPIGMSINTHDYEGRQARITIDKPEFKPHVKIIEEKLLNRFWYVNNPFMIIRQQNFNENCWFPGDFIVHVTGYEKNDRIKLLSDLSYFVGGLIGCWDFNEHYYEFSPLIDLDATKVEMWDVENNRFIYYNFEKLHHKGRYRLYLNDEFKNKSVIIKGYNNDELISLKLKS
jgi:hypothetical protein